MSNSSAFVFKTYQEIYMDEMMSTCAPYVGAMIHEQLVYVFTIGVLLGAVLAIGMYMWGRWVRGRLEGDEPEL